MNLPTRRLAFVFLLFLAGCESTPQHTFTYAATFLASLQLVEKLSTPANASAAQTINSALSGGLLMGAATIGSGWLFDLVGAKGYLAMALMSALGLAGALRLYGIKRLDP